MAAIKDLVGEKVINKDGEEFNVEELCKDKKAIGIYFSAHWCPPCRGFTPVLSEFYNQNSMKFVVIFASSDRDKKSFEGYLNEMPWYAIPFENRAIKEALSQKYGVTGIPTLIILKPDGTTMEASGRSVVAGRTDMTFPPEWE